MSSSRSPNADADPALLSCLEVWGGNQSTDRNVVMRGLDAWVLSQAHGSGTKGGDVYYLSSCATGRIIRLLVADVSGHGSAVVEPAQALRTLMRRYVNQLDQRGFVRAMNGAFSAQSLGGIFATAVVATYFAPTRTLTLTNAGHPPPFHYAADAGAWTIMESKSPGVTGPTDIPLGILDVSDYAQHALRLRHGDLVVCYTDSLIESRDSRGEQLGLAGLKAVIDQLDAGKPSLLIPRLVEALLDLNPRNLSQDDVTVMVFSPNRLFETAGMPGLPTHLAAMKKFGKALITRGEPVPWPDLHPANLGGVFFKSLNKLWGRRLRD